MLWQSRHFDTDNRDDHLSPETGDNAELGDQRK